MPRTYPKCKNHPEKMAVKDGLCYQCYKKEKGEAPFKTGRAAKKAAKPRVLSPPGTMKGGRILIAVNRTVFENGVRELCDKLAQSMVEEMLQKFDLTEPKKRPGIGMEDVEV